MNERNAEHKMPHFKRKITGSTTLIQFNDVSSRSLSHHSNQRQSKLTLGENDFNSPFKTGALNLFFPLQVIQLVHLPLTAELNFFRACVADVDGAMPQIDVHAHSIQKEIFK